MKKDNLIRLHINDYTGSQNNKKTLKRYKYQVTPKAEYSSMGEAVDEYMKNFGTVLKTGEDFARNNPQLFNHQYPHDGESYLSVTNPVNMGDGYSVYFGTLLPEKEDGLYVIPIKIFRLKWSKNQYRLGFIAPKNNGKSPAVFTEDFLQKVDNLPDYNEGLFFFISCHMGFLSVHGKDVRWLFNEGMAIGQASDGFYYFDEFTDKIKFPMMELTDSVIKILETMMWNY